MKQIFCKLAIALFMLFSTPLVHAVINKAEATRNLELKFNREKVRQRVIALRAKERNLLEQQQAGQNVMQQLEALQQDIQIAYNTMEELSRQIHKMEEN
jgi:peptidoglycan hydrolase CwlO-like protein